MKIAFLFSGQGSQYVGMGQDVYNNFETSKNLFDKVNNLYNEFDIKELCFQDPNNLINQTRYTQIALFVTNLAVYEAVVSSNITPEAIIGYSLGEYSALVASGIVNLEDGLNIVESRATFMEEACKLNEGAMSAVLGLEIETIREVCEEVTRNNAKVCVANDNCPSQTVISGVNSGVKLATEKLLEKGARRVVSLNVSGAFHSPLMQSAGEKLEQVLENFTFNEPKLPIISNYSANYMTAEQAKNYIPNQTTTGVRFRESIEKLIEDGFDTFVEIGAKKTLSGFVSKISKDVQVYNIEDVKSLNKTLEKLGGHIDA